VRQGWANLLADGAACENSPLLAVQSIRDNRSVHDGGGRRTAWW
jgi:hypothetical protein